MRRVTDPLIKRNSATQNEEGIVKKKKMKGR